MHNYTISTIITDLQYSTLNINKLMCLIDLSIFEKETLRLASSIFIHNIYDKCYHIFLCLYNGSNLI